MTPTAQAPTQGAPLLEARNLSKSFGPVQALTQVSLTASVGEVVGLIGENGAGKSTLLSLISGTLVPDEGSILVDGRKVRPSGYHEATELGIFRIYQHQALIPTLSVQDNLFLGQEEHFTRWGAVRRSAMTRRARSVFDDLGIEGIDPERPISRYSFAERQIVEISRSLAQADLLEIENPVILLDEPTSALSREQVDFFSAFVQRVKPRAAQVFISHRLQELLALSDRVYVLKDGRTVAHRDDVADLDEGELHSLMVGRTAEGRFYREEEQRGSAGPLVLSARGLTQAGQFHDVDLDLHEGEVLGLGGVIGSGKSALGRSLFEGGAGAGGGVHLAGGRPAGRGVRASIRAGIGYVPPERHAEGMIGLLSVARNISLPRHGSVDRSPVVGTAAERRTADAAIEQLDIRTPSRDTPLDRLSGGNQQKTIVARWTALGSRVLILDNPTNGVDVGAKAEIYRLVRDLTAGGVAVLLLSDELTELIGLSDRIHVMKDGRIVRTVEAPPGDKPDESALVRDMV